MKAGISFMIMFLLSCFIQIQAQTLSVNLGEDASMAEPTTLAPPAYLKNSFGIVPGGKHITADGVLKILIVFVRFSDDYVNTDTWTNYTTLPTWAANMVDNSVPANGIYANENLSNFIDRFSGGDGSGNAGDLQIIGDVYYVSLSNPRSTYFTDIQVNNEVIDILDDTGGPFNIDFREYDNWEFKVGNTAYVHDYRPYNSATGTGGDGNLDFMAVFWRDISISRASDVGGVSSISMTATTRDGISITTSSGITGFKAREFYNFKVIRIISHELGHNMMGISGGNYYSHFDRKNINEGNISFSSLMVNYGGKYFNAYEKYRLGWLEPTVITANTTGIQLDETYIENEAILIPVRYDASSNLKEFYLIENFHTTNDYGTANPFLDGNPFTNSIGRGIYIYHIEDEDLTYPTRSVLDMECSDGRWNWNLSTGASTEAYRQDDTIFRQTENAASGYDERDYITITVGSTTYIDYSALTPTSGPATTENLNTRRYTRDDSLGDQEDLFDEENSYVFSKYSNPSTLLASGTHSNVGLEIVSYNSSTKEYTLNIGFGDTFVATPRNLRAGYLSTQHPSIIWDPVVDQDLTGYQVYRQYNNGGWYLIATTGSTDTSYIDSGIVYDKPIFEYDVNYKIRAKDTGNHTSQYSNIVYSEGRYNDDPRVMQSGGTQKQLEEEYDYSIASYPNPFNPVSKINFSLPSYSFVKIKVYSSIGEEIRTLTNNYYSKGNHCVLFNASDLPSGLYIVTIQAEGYFDRIKVMLTK